MEYVKAFFFGMALSAIIIVGHRLGMKLWDNAKRLWQKREGDAVWDMIAAITVLILLTKWL